MRVLVMGTGGVGGYYGGMLAQQGHEVVFVARGAHLEALQGRGLELRTTDGTVRLNPITAVARPADAGGSFDLVLFTVKTYDTEAAAAAIEPVVGTGTAVLPLQNGVDAVDQLKAVLGPGPVLGGMTQIGARIVEPGVVERFSPFCQVVLGEPPAACPSVASGSRRRCASWASMPAPARTSNGRSGRSSCCWRPWPA